MFSFQGVTHQQWYLFNDFLIEPIDKVNISPLGKWVRRYVEVKVLCFCLSKTEAAQFDVSWKVPAILYYAKRNYHTKYDLRSKPQDVKPKGFTCRFSFSSHRFIACVSVKNPIDASVLLTEASLARKQRKSHATFIPLMVSEMPQAGDLVGLDAEFVTLNQVSFTLIIKLLVLLQVIDTSKNSCLCLSPE